MNNQNKFNTDVAVVELGVGKNMVNSIRFWLKSFGLLDEDDNLNEIANFLFSDKGKGIAFVATSVEDVTRVLRDIGNLPW